MNIRIPQLSLTQGQVLWALCHGEYPREAKLKQLVEQLRYLRQLGVPFNEKSRGQGRGNRVRYNFEELAELGIAVYALRRGMRPKEVAQILTAQRKDIRQQCTEAVEAQPEAGLHHDWVKSRGKSYPILGNQRFLRFHNRYSETAGMYEIIGPSEAKQLEDIFGTKETFPDGESFVLIPLARIVLPLLAWALEAPDIRPGRNG